MSDQSRLLRTDPTVTIRCVICDHQFTVLLTPDMPMCPQCFGPVVVERVRK